MKYCPKCGKELFDEAVICVGCGCPVKPQKFNQEKPQDLLNVLSERIKINSIIWLVIGILQIIGAIYLNWILLVVGILNIVSSVNDMNYCKTIVENPKGIVEKFEPLTGPIVVFIYNLIIGGFVGVIGSVYYFVGIRTFVLENKSYFQKFDEKEDLTNENYNA